MSVSSFQYLKQPFNRCVDAQGEYWECDSYPAPQKPYFKGTDCIPEDHPSRSIRETILRELGSSSTKNYHFPGNATTSSLHDHESIFHELCKHLEDEGGESIHCIGNGEFESVPTFTEKMEVVEGGDHHFVIPKACGFFVGDILHFMKHPMQLQFDIVGASIPHDV